MLFQVPNTQAYVLGSIHALPRGDNSLPGEVWRVAGQAKRLVFEVNLEQIPPSPPVAALEAGDSLRRYLPPQLYEATAALWVGLGGDLQLMDRLKVWRVSQLLMIHLIENHSEHTLSQGVDVQLWRSARQTGRTPHALERMEMFHALDSAPVAEQAMGLARLVSQPLQARQVLPKLVAGWRESNIEVAEAFLALLLSVQPNTYRALLFARNRLWLPGIIDHLRSEEPTLVIVGFLHVLGAEGLPALLREQGVAVERVDLAHPESGGLLSSGRT